jgi:hypothetical protein
MRGIRQGEQRPWREHAGLTDTVARGRARSDGGGVDGLHFTLTEREVMGLRGIGAAEAGYTVAATFVSTLTLISQATGVRYALSVADPHALTAGEELNFTLFVRLPVLERADDAGYTLELTLDTTDVVTERNENNTFTLDFTLCFPEIYLATDDRPRPALSVHERAFGSSSGRVRLMFSEDVTAFHPTPAESTGLPALQLSGCVLDAHSVREQLRSWWLDVTFLENNCTIHVRFVSFVAATSNVGALSAEGDTGRATGAPDV